MTRSQSETSPLWKRLIRVRVLSTVLILIVLLIGYSYLFLDDHLEWFLEDQLTQSLGVEVNLGDLSTGWTTPSVKIRKIEVTDPDQPDRNWIEVGTLRTRFSALPLLRLKYLLEESELRGLKFGTQRTHTGWVDPEGGDLGWIFKSSEQVLKSSLEQQTAGTLLESGIELLSGTSIDALLEKYREDLKTPRKLETVQTNLEDARTKLNSLEDGLPSRKDLDQLRNELEALKSSEDDGIIGTVNRARAVQQLTDRIKKYKSRLTSFSLRLKDLTGSLRNGVDGVNSAISSDLNMIRSRLSLPSLDLENPSEGILRDFVERRFQSLRQHLVEFSPYLGSVLEDAMSRTKSEDTKALKIVQSGRDYQFVVHDQYPDLLVRSFEISGSEDEWSLGGRIKNLSRPNGAVPKPLELSFEAEGYPDPGVRYTGSLVSGTSEFDYHFHIEGLTASNWLLSESESFRFGVKRTTGTLRLEGKYDRNQLVNRLNLSLSDPVFLVETSQSDLREALRQSLDRLSELRVQASMTGLSIKTLEIHSNLDENLRLALRSYLSGQLDSTKKQLTRTYRKRYGTQVENYSKAVQELRGQYETRLSKIRSRLDDLTGSLKSRLKSSSLDEKKFSLPSF